MTRIILDSRLSNQLHDLTHPVELCDPSGRVLGRFVPSMDTTKIEICDSSGRVLGRFDPLMDMTEWEPVSPAASEEELDRREQANEKRYTTAEVLAHLEKL